MNNEEVEVLIDFEKLPNLIVVANRKGYRDFEMIHLPEIRQWMLDQIPDTTDVFTSITVTGRLPAWMAMWVGIEICDYADEIRFRAKNTPSIILKGEGI